MLEPGLAPETAWRASPSPSALLAAVVGIDAVNPFSGTVNALDAMVIDRQGWAAQGRRLALVLAWLALAYAAALR